MVSRLSSQALYLDTNVYDHILHKKGGVNDAHISAFNAALKNGNFFVPLSLLVVEETILALKSVPELANQQLQLVGKVSNIRTIFKPPDQLLQDDVRAFVRGRKSTPFMKANRHLRRQIHDILVRDQNASELEEVMNLIRSGKEDFRRFMRATKKRVESDLTSVESEPQSFERYLQLAAPDLAEDYAQQAGRLSQCKEKGINKLLDGVESLRLSVAANLSMIYGQIVDGWSPQIGDAIDMRHCVLASVAATFISQDNRFRKLMSRIPHDPGFVVLDLVSWIESHL